MIVMKIIVLLQARIEDDLPLELISKITIIDLASRDKNVGYFNFVSSITYRLHSINETLSY